MRWIARNRNWAAVGVVAAVVFSSAWLVGCGGAAGIFNVIGAPFPVTDSSGGGGGGTGGDDRTNVDPCTESQSRKFVRITLQNLDPDDFIHYFLVLVAFVRGETYPDGAVCEDDVALYTSFGYIEIPEGQQQEFGNFCVTGPALLYFHQGGQFRQAGASGSSDLAGGLAPAQGSNASFDVFFSSAGAVVPVPNLIVFHNPGSGEGASLKISRNSPNPCDPSTTQPGTNPCLQDSFYYVDDQDIMAGSTALGTGSGRRVPSEIQDTGCACLGFNQPWHQLAPSRVSASNARCNEFLRGGHIEYFFIRDDQNPPIPQLLWRVTDESGSIVHTPDPRAFVP